MDNDPTIRELFNAFKGYQTRLEYERDLQWFLTKYSVLRSGMLDEKGQRKVEKEKAPWEIDMSNKTDEGYISYDAIKGNLDLISE